MIKRANKRGSKLLGLSLVFMGLSIGIGTGTANAQTTSEQMSKAVDMSLACSELAELDMSFDLNKAILKSHKSLVSKNKISIAVSELDRLIKDYAKQSAQIVLGSSSTKDNKVIDEKSQEQAVQLVRNTNSKLVALSQKLGFNSNANPALISNTNKSLIDGLLEKAMVAGGDEAIASVDYTKFIEDMKILNAQNLSTALGRAFSEDDSVVRKIQNNQGLESLSGMLNQYNYALSLVLNVMKKEAEILASDRWGAEFSIGVSKDLKNKCPEDYELN